MDRQGLLSPNSVHNLSMEPIVTSDDDGGAPARSTWRNSLRRLTAPLVFLGSLALKLGSLAKFAAIFVAFGGYTLIWGWKFAVGLIALIFVHEMGHFLEASREHLHPPGRCSSRSSAPTSSTPAGTPGRPRASPSPGRCSGDWPLSSAA